MKRFLMVFLVLGLVAGPMVMAQDTPAPVVDESAVVVVEAEPIEEAPAPVVEPAPAPESKPIKLPWVVVFLWPFLSTALIGIIKAVSDRFQAVVPPQLWPIANAVITALIVGIQSSGTPYEVIGNVVAAVLAALGMTKTLDSTRGKWSTITPADKAKARDAGVIE